MKSDLSQELRTSRRALLKNIAWLTGAAVVGADLLLTGCTSPNSKPFTKETIQLLDELAETIIPTTATPGAKSARVGAFMEIMVNDCYTQEERTIFLNGVASLKKLSVEKTKKEFTNCLPAERERIVASLESSSKKFNLQKKKEELPHYYTMMKQLTLLGFFTSETGMTETLRHDPVPGPYEGDLPYYKGEKAWSE